MQCMCRLHSTSSAATRLTAITWVCSADLLRMNALLSVTPDNDQCVLSSRSEFSSLRSLLFAVQLSVLQFIQIFPSYTEESKQSFHRVAFVYNAIHVLSPVFFTSLYDAFPIRIIFCLLAAYDVAKTLHVWVLNKLKLPVTPCNVTVRLAYQELSSDSVFVVA